MSRRDGITSIFVRATLFLVVAAGALGLHGALGTSAARAADTFPIVNTLGAASPTTTFSVFGAGGQPLSGSSLVGPRFELTQPAVITEIGAFLNNCRTIVGGQPQCPGTLPFRVQIRPSPNGVPHPSSVLATFVLSHDDNPLVVSYESVSTSLSLGAGTYFAMFASQGADAGFVAGFASSRSRTSPTRPRWDSSTPRQAIPSRPSSLPQFASSAEQRPPTSSCSIYSTSSPRARSVRQSPSAQCSSPPEPCSEPATSRPPAIPSTSSLRSSAHEPTRA
jgi:hypothetical protein